MVVWLCVRENPYLSMYALKCFWIQWSHAWNLLPSTPAGCVGEGWCHRWKRRPGAGWWVHGWKLGDGNGGSLYCFLSCICFQFFHSRSLKQTNKDHPCSMSAITALFKQRAWDYLHGSGYNPLSSSRGLLAQPGPSHPYQLSSVLFSLITLLIDLLVLTVLHWAEST